VAGAVVEVLDVEVVEMVVVVVAGMHLDQ